MERDIYFKERVFNVTVIVAVAPEMFLMDANITAGSSYEMSVGGGAQNKEPSRENSHSTTPVSGS